MPVHDDSYKMLAMEPVAVFSLTLLTKGSVECAFLIYFSVKFTLRFALHSVVEAVSILLVMVAGCSMIVAMISI